MNTALIHSYSTIEAWGANSPREYKSPQERRKRGLRGEATRVTPSGACKLVLPDKKDKHRTQEFEKMLKEENIIEGEEFVTHIMEEASFNDTIGEIEEVVDWSYPHDQHTISIRD